jgi:hypothetical protein
MVARSAMPEQQIRQPAATFATDGLTSRHSRRDSQPGPARPRSGPTSLGLAETLRPKPTAAGSQSSTAQGAADASSHPVAGPSESGADLGQRRHHLLP